MPHIARDYERYMGGSVPDGHCVALVKVCANLPATSAWRRGDQVRGANCEKGTVVATFDPNGRYGNHTDLRSHAAILVAENSDGLLVVDQWLGQNVHQRTIRFRNGSGDAANDGDRYFVVELTG